MAATEDRSPEITAQVTEQNVRTIADLERAAIEKRSVTERVSDGITRVIGSLPFLAAHLLGLFAWFAVNLQLVPGLRPFDPFPFGILTLIVSTEGVLLAIFVLISQNRMTRLSNQRAHLNLQISLLSEQETTRLLQEMRRLSGRLGGGEAEDDEILRLSERTHLQTLAENLEKNLPDE